MPRLTVPLFTPVYRNVNKEELSDQSYELIDGYLSESGYCVKRPNLDWTYVLGANSSAPVTGLYWWAAKNVVIAVCDKRIFKLTVSNNGITSVTDITGDPLNGGANPVFASGVNSNVSSPTFYNLIAGGGRIIESNGTGTSVSSYNLVADADAPTTASHIDFIDGYVIATTGKGFFQYSDVNAPLTWSAASFATAMRNPDIIRALKVYRRQIFLFGDLTTEVWENDGSSPFSPAPGGFFDIGISAPYSIVAADEGIYWLSHTRHFVGVEDGGIKRISTPYDKEVMSFSSVEDCIGYKIEIRGRPFIVFNFVSEGRTLVYELTNKTWSEWAYWNKELGEYENFIGRSYCYCPKYGLHLMGARDGYRILLMNDTYLSNTGDSSIRFKRTTGHIDYGTNANKRCKELTFRAKRGTGLNSFDVSAEAKLMLRWNDDNKGWSNEEVISLGKKGEREIVVKCFPKGIYRTRQYEVTLTDAVAFTFGQAEEEVDILA